MDNFLFMAFAKGQVSTDAADIKRYIGYAPVKVLALNPTKEQVKELLGYEPKEEPVYTGTQEVDGKNIDYARVSFIIETTEEPIIRSTLSFYLRNQYVKGSQSGKYQVIDHYGNTAWAEESVIKAHQPVMYSNGPAKLIGAYRPVYTGEVELVNFFKEYLGLGSVGDTNGYNYVNGTWVPKSGAELDDCECFFEEASIKKMFKGDFSDVKEGLELQPKNEVKVAFGIRTNSEGREYQDVYTRVIRKASKKLEYIFDYIAERKSNGAMSNRTFECCPLKEYKVEPTDFSNVSSSDLPFDDGAVDDPWK